MSVCFTGVHDLLENRVVRGCPVCREEGHCGLLNHHIACPWSDFQQELNDMYCRFAGFH